MDKENKDEIDYTLLIDRAMHYVVKSVLQKIKAEGGLPGEHHFFITFNTNYKGVMISDELKEKYPEEMTIVLQHQYTDLEVEEDYFSVVLSFDHVKQNLTIPFDALISFVDPSVKFGLQFNSILFSDEESDEDLLSELSEIEGSLELEGISAKSKKENAKSIDKTEKEISNVVTLDSFRKKK